MKLFCDLFIAQTLFFTQDIHIPLLRRQLGNGLVQDLFQFIIGNRICAIFSFRVLLCNDLP